MDCARCVWHANCRRKLPGKFIEVCSEYVKKRKEKERVRESGKEWERQNNIMKFSAQFLWCAWSGMISIPHLPYFILLPASPPAPLFPLPCDPSKRASNTKEKKIKRGSQKPSPLPRLVYVQEFLYCGYTIFFNIDRLPWQLPPAFPRAPNFSWFALKITRFSSSA